jgi:hypothetical protein
VIGGNGKQRAIVDVFSLKLLSSLAARDLNKKENLYLRTVRIVRNRTIQRA